MISDIRDIEPHSTGFFNRGAESVTIIGNIIGDLLNGFGNAISGVSNSVGGTQHQSDVFTNPSQVPPQLTKAERTEIVSNIFPNKLHAVEDADRIQDFVDESNTRDPFKFT